MKKTFIGIMLVPILLFHGCGGTDINKTTSAEYSITYHLDGGTVDDNPLVYSGSMGKITLKIPTKVSCTFMGWFTDSEFENQITKLDNLVNKDMDIYARWANGIVERKYSFDLGIGKEYVIYQVSDMHVNAGNSEEDLQKEKSRLNESRINYANKFNEEYDVNHICKESKQGFIDLLNYVNNENPYAVCYSGDIMDFYSKENYDFIKTEIVKTNAPFVYAMGNHEDPVANYEKMPGVNTTEFTVLEFDDFEIVCMDNGHSFYTSNQYDLLLAETKKNKPIIIVQHVPIVTSYNKKSELADCGKYYYMDGSESAINKSVIDLICNNENIKLVLSGHIHGATNTEIAEGKYQLTCSSGLMGNVNRIKIR